MKIKNLFVLGSVLSVLICSHVFAEKSWDREHRKDPKLRKCGPPVHYARGKKIDSIEGKSENNPSTAMEGTSLMGSDVSDKKFKFVTLEGTDLSNSIAHRARFENCKLKNTHFRGAYAHDAVFLMDGLDSVNFSRADLRGAKFYKEDKHKIKGYKPKVKLCGVKFENAILYGADLSGSELVLKGNECERDNVFRGAKFNFSTLFPINPRTGKTYTTFEAIAELGMTLVTPKCNSNSKCICENINLDTLKEKELLVELETTEPQKRYDATQASPFLDELKENLQFLISQDILRDKRSTTREDKSSDTPSGSNKKKGRAVPTKK